MIVCLCRGISDRQVNEAIDNGATCAGRLEQSGIGGDCRGCERTLETMLDKAEQSGRITRCTTCACVGVLASA